MLGWLPSWHWLPPDNKKIYRPIMLNCNLTAFSDDGTLLGIYSSTGVLKLWDTSSNILEHEFQPSEHLSATATCILFSPKRPPKKKKRSHGDTDTPDLIALGTVAGDILIYSPSRQKVTEEWKHSSTSSVTSLCWSSSKRLISVGENKKLIAWEVDAGKQWEVDVVANKSCCALGANNFVTSDTNIQFVSYNKSTKEFSNYVIPSHKRPIRQLVPVFLNDSSKSMHFLTVADGDKYVYAWSTNEERKDPVGCFMVKDIAGNVCCKDIGGSTVGIAVTTKTGLLRYYEHYFNGAEFEKPSKYKGILRISTKGKQQSCLPIINAKFLSSTELLIAYGTELFPCCERVQLESLEGEVILTRKDPSLFQTSKEATLVKTITPTVSDSTVHLTPTFSDPIEIKEIKSGTKRKKGGDAASLPMEERLDAHSITQPLGVGGSRPLDNYVHLLIQALHSKDSGLMNSLLSKGEDEEVVNNTVRRLPVSHVVPLLQYLQDVIVSKGLKNLCCIAWIKSVLYYHMSYLSSVPDKDSILQPFYSIFAARSTSYSAVAKLHARLNLLLMHVKNRHENATAQSTNADTTAEALLKYTEESDEEDKFMDLEVGPSESEDNWDDWTEAEEEEEQQEQADENEEDEEKKEEKSGAKRKMNCDNGDNNESDGIEDKEDSDNIDSDESHMTEDEGVQFVSDSE